MQSPDRATERLATRAMILFLLASTLTTLLSYRHDILYSVVHGVAISDGFPWGDAGARYTDMINYQTRFGYLHTDRFYATSGYFWAFYPFVYPVFAAVVCAGIFAFGTHALAAYLVTTVCGFALAATVFASKVAVHFQRPAKAYLLVALTGLTSFPILFLLLRGNIEGYGFFMVAAAIWAYHEERWTVCAVMMGLAAAFKLFPVILIGLLLSQKKYREGLLAVFTFVVAELGSAAFLGPTIPVALASMANGLLFFKKMFGLTFLSFQFDHSLFSLWKVIETKIWPNVKITSSALQAYLATAAMAALLLYWFRIRKLPRTNQVAALVSLSILLPPVSFVYTTTHMYAVWAVLVVYLLRERPSSRTRNSMMAAMLFLGLACTNMDLVNFNLATFSFNGLGWGGVIQCICLSTVVALASLYPWPETTQNQGLNRAA